MKLVILFLLLVFSITTSAQPGYVVIVKNLNDLTLEETTIIKDSPDYYKTTIIIDSTTVLDRLHLLKDLTNLNFTIDLSEFPNELSELNDNLEVLQLNFSPKMKSEVILQDFKNLKTLTIGGYTGEYFEIKDLPELKILQTSGFNEENLYIRNVPKLNQIILSQYEGEKLPVCLQKLSSITNLKVRSDHLLNIDLATGFDNLTRLEVNSKNLSSFPEFDPENNITYLYLTVDSGFIAYHNISTLTQLETLLLVGGDMNVFPDDLAPSLKQLYLQSLPHLSDVRSIDQYHNLTSLSIFQTGLEEFSNDLSELKELKSFRISNNSSLRSIEGIGTIVALKEIKIESLPALQCMDFDMGKTNFEKIILNDLPVLENINAVTSCPHLKVLVIVKTGLSKLPDNFHQMDSLTELGLRHNSQLMDISGLKNMKNLKRLFIYECNALEKIPASFNTNISVESIRLEFMSQLDNLKGIAGLPNLKFLYLRAVNEDLKLPKNLSRSSHIEEIIIESKINDASMIKNLKNLKHLRIMYSLSNLPTTLYTNTNLKKFELYQSEVTDLTGLIKLQNLEELYIRHNPELVKMPDLTKFPSLKIVKIQDNKNLIISKPSTHKYNFDWVIKKNAN